MKAIGGFFELEIKQANPGERSYHPDSLGLTTGRACLSFILEKVKPNRVFVPYYTCNALLEPIKEKGIDYVFYGVDKQLEIAEDLVIGPGEYLIYINYFGLKAQYMNQLKAKYGNSLIFDNTQAYFYSGKNENWSFNSARKFFGVPDGAYLNGPDLRYESLERNSAVSLSHLADRFNGLQQQAYQEFTAYEESLNSEVKGISMVSEALLAAVDYQDVMEKRRENFKVYQEAFRSVNQFEFELSASDVPFCYPLLLDKDIDRQQLFAAGIFIPTLWYDVVKRGEAGFEFDKEISARLLPLPVDHRYGKEECAYVSRFIKDIINNG